MTQEYQITVHGVGPQAGGKVRGSTSAGRFVPPHSLREAWLAGSALLRKGEEVELLIGIIKNSSVYGKAGRSRAEGLKNFIFPD
jgi:hypothetical protein